MIRRIGGLGGLAFLFLTLSTLFVAPAPPDVSASSAELAAYVRDNATGIELQAVIFGLAALGLVGFAAGVHHRLGAGEQLGGLLAAAWSGVTLLAGGWALSYAIGAGLALAADRLSDDAIVLGYVAYGAAASIGGMGTAIFLGSIALLGRLEHALPNWLTVLAAIGAALNVAGLATMTTDSSAVFSILYVAFGVFAIWVIAVSVDLLRTGADSKVLTPSSVA